MLTLGPIGRFVSASPLHPDNREREKILESLRTGWDGRNRLRNKGFCAQCANLGEVELHHITPLREAFLVFDHLQHDRGDNLIPLCSGCHGHAKRDLTRDYLRKRADAFKSGNIGLCPRQEPRKRSTPEIAIAAGVRPGSLPKRLPDTSSATAATFIDYVSIERRAAKNGKLVWACIQHLDTAWDLSTNDRERALIAYNQGKLYRLLGRPSQAIKYNNQSIDLAQEDLYRNMAIYSRDWDEVFAASPGLLCPDALQLGDSGLKMFAGDPMAGSWEALKWGGYSLCDRAQGLAARLRPDEAISCLAEAEHLADVQGFEVMRPPLYRVLAQCFRLKEDWWRALLASSVAWRYYFNDGIREEAGVALYEYLLALKHLNLQSDFDAAGARVRGIIPEMGNTWALRQIARELDAPRH